MWLSLFTCSKGNQQANTWHDLSSALETVCLPLKYMNSIIIWIQVKSIIRYLLIVIVSIQRHYGYLTHNPQLWRVLVLKLTSTTPPHISVSADRRQSPLSVCTEDFVSYDTSSSQNLHWHSEVLIVFCQTFSVVLQYGGSCKKKRSCWFLQ